MAVGARRIRPAWRATTILVALAAVWGASALAADEPSKDLSEEEREALERELAAARDELAAAAREVARLSAQLTAEVVPNFVMQFTAPLMGRAMLGINIGRAGSDEEAIGVEVVSVSPGGPADRAGLQSGDRIVAVDGERLERDGSQSPRDRLLAHLRKVEPGDKVAVEYERDGQRQRVEIVTEAFVPMMRALREGIAMPPMSGVFGAVGAFSSLELVRLTPELGAYFGSETGLLVVRAPQDPPLGLKDGDVLLDIGGRAPTSPGHAYRILGSYQSGEKLKLTVLRHGKRLVLDVEVPEGSVGFLPRSPEAMAFPAAGAVRIDPPRRVPAPMSIRPPAPESI